MNQFHRKEEKHFTGKEDIYKFKTEEFSEFDKNGHVRTLLKTEQNITKGIMPQDPRDIVGECQSCYQLLTKEMFSTCENCNNVCCKPCSVKNQEMHVCSLCSGLLNQSRLRMIIRKFFIDPFWDVK